MKELVKKIKESFREGGYELKEKEYVELFFKEVIPAIKKEFKAVVEEKAEGRRHVEIHTRQQQVIANHIDGFFKTRMSEEKGKIVKVMTLLILELVTWLISIDVAYENSKLTELQPSDTTKH